MAEGLTVRHIPAALARDVAEREHYMHRKPVVSHAFGLYEEEDLVGVCVCSGPQRRVTFRSACCRMSRAG